MGGSGRPGEEEGRQLEVLRGLPAPQQSHTEGLVPVPSLDDTLDYIGGSRWFSSLDLRSGYWQVELEPAARRKTAFTIGSSHAVQIVQRAGYVRTDDGEGTGRRPPESLCRVPG